MQTCSYAHMQGGKMFEHFASDVNMFMNHCLSLCCGPWLSASMKTWMLTWKVLLEQINVLSWFCDVSIASAI